MDRETPKSLTALVEWLYTEFYKCMVMRIIGIVGKDAAEDIAQTLMSRLLEYKDPEKLLRMTPNELQSYAMKAVFNMALDRRRKILREMALDINTEELEYTDLGDFQDMEIKEILYHLVSSLPQREREIMELRIQEPELTQEEIAEQLGLHRTTVNRRYKKAIKLLRSLYSKQGYEIAVVGESRRTASYAGIKVDRVIIRTMALSGALCGLIGLLLTSSTDHAMTTTIVDGRGFTAVMVSWMAKFNPIIMIFVSLLLVVLNRGAGEISTAFGLNRSFADILTGIILFFIIGCEFFINYKVQFRTSGKKEA